MLIAENIIALEWQHSYLKSTHQTLSTELVAMHSGITFFKIDFLQSNVVNIFEQTLCQEYSWCLKMVRIGCSLGFEAKQSQTFLGVCLFCNGIK